MIRSLAAILIALLMMGALALPAQADTISTFGTLTGTSTLTATSNPAVLDSSFTGSGVDSMFGAFTTTNLGTITFTTSITTVPEPGSVTLLLAGIGFLLVMRKRWARA